MTETRLKRPPPSEPMRLMMAGFMAFIKGGIGAAIVVAPFFGIGAAFGVATVFALFCVWLAHRAGPGVGLVNAGPSMSRKTSVELGFTADLDNKKIPREKLDAFYTIYASDVEWQAPTAQQVKRFEVHEAHKAADDLVAVSRDGTGEYWVMENVWSGFPDPAEYLFLGLSDDGEVFAAGRFEDWPENWGRACVTS